MNEDMLPEPEFTEEQEILQPAEPLEPAAEQTDAGMESMEGPQVAEEPPKKENWQKRLFKDARDVLYMLAIFMLVYILCFRSVVVVGDSMYDTLVNGDRLLLINSMLYSRPKAGDVIVASKDTFRNGECIIKRIIAVEGQEVDIDFESGAVYVDGVALDEPYLYSLTLDYEGVDFPLTVPEGCLFVMGDNRENSEDSRSHQIGFIDEREVLGKAVFVVIPGYDEKTDTRDFGRIGVIG